MPGAGKHPAAGFFRREIEKHKAQVRYGMAQGVAVALFQRRTGEDGTFAGLEGGLQFFAQADQPTGTVVVVQGNSGAHLGDIGSGVEGIAFDQAAAALAGDGGTDGALAAASYAHYHDRGQGWVHRYLLQGEIALSLAEATGASGAPHPDVIDFV
ncbi:hypothetical protein D3C77_549910 [compost metagenome]